jgi:basic amino acid/polyamine antiporter, APA family
MATTTASPPRQTLFLRNATGLVKAWSTFDAFLYSFWSVNLVTLGLYGMSFLYAIPDGQALGAVLLTGVLVTFLVITYAMMVSAMPRAGGDYAWQSRILGGGLGFVLSITGWWFTLWLWTPIYANILVVQFFSPLAYTLGLSGVATFFGSHAGVFVSCLIVLAFVSYVVTAGMETYARIQKFCFWLGMAGLLAMIGLLLFSNHDAFVQAFNREAQSLFGASSNAYQATLDAAAKGGTQGVSFGTTAFGSTLLLLPFLAFYLLWPNWGATLYGEVRGAKEYRKVFSAMFWGLWITVALVAVILLLIVKTIGWDFYYAANAAYWNSIYVAGAPAPAVPVWPYPVMLAGWLVNSHLFQAVLIAVMGLWFFGWAGTLFLSSTRVIFAAAFDRVLPEFAANISSKRRVPYGALLLMIVPAILISLAWSFAPSIQTWFLWATGVIAITFLGTSIAAAILPWRRPDIFQNSPIARYKIAGVPVITITGLVSAVFLLFMLAEWSFNAIYGTQLADVSGGVKVSNPSTLIYFAGTYLLAIAIYVAARVIRKNQGIDLARIHREIPVE